MRASARAFKRRWRAPLCQCRSTSAYPAILALPAPRLLAYPKETVIAERLEAMVALGMLNRLKD